MELRWFNRERWAENSNEEVELINERVLQFRVRKGPEGEDWWGEWTDVPEVFQ